jgi:hypothetical protein
VSWRKALAERATNLLASSPTTAVKLISGIATAGLVVGAVAIGAGAPLSPARIARATSDAARNLEVAQENTQQAARDTEALATIEKNVGSQLDTSRRMLDTQLGIERSSEEGLEVSKVVVTRIDRVNQALTDVVGRLEGISSLSNRITAAAENAEGAADTLETRLEILMERYEVAVRESRKLNRKARAFEEVAP